MPTRLGWVSRGRYSDGHLLSLLTLSLLVYALCSVMSCIVLACHCNHVLIWGLPMIRKFLHVTCVWASVGCCVRLFFFWLAIVSRQLELGQQTQLVLSLRTYYVCGIVLMDGMNNRGVFLAKYRESRRDARWITAMRVHVFKRPVYIYIYILIYKVEIS